MHDIAIHGYFPGVIGKITDLHAVYYHAHWGFDISFETQVGRELSDFMSAYRPERDRLWAVTVKGRFAGAAAVDGRLAATQGARLRWFIVAPEYQDCGIGQKLVQQAVDFCRDRGFERLYLWTFAGLDAARSLYERSGFSLCEELPVTQWGQTIREQQFELLLSAGRTGAPDRLPP